MGLGVSGKKIQTFPNPQSRLVFPAGGRERARASLGYAPGELLISTVGHAVPVKAWDVLVRAFGEVSRSWPEARLLLVGGYDAPHERATFAELKAWIEPRGLSGKIRFLGHVENVAEPLQASDVFVLPSRSEGHSNALLDGLAAGLPVVASRVGAASEVIRNGENGLLVNREDTAQLVLALDRLLGDAALRRRMGEEARKPLDLPTPDQYTERMFSVYRDLLQGAGREPALASHRSQGTR
jgi:glycosyltransferase involved in cell wall biosynthesis